MLTDEDIEQIVWRATRGCHFEGAFLGSSDYAKTVVENDVPTLIAEIRRLRATEQPMNPSDKFHKHLEGCKRCEENPFNLCAEGTELLLKTVSSPLAYVPDV